MSRLIIAGQRILVAVGILAAFSSSAQTNVVTVTNYVTVVITNIVTVTNIVAAVQALAPGPKVIFGPPAPVGHPWLSSITAGMTLTRGNSHTLLYNGEFQSEKKTTNDDFVVGLGGAYGSQDSKENVNNYHTSGQWNHMITEKFYTYVRANALRDFIADVDYRVNLGPGMGYYLIKQTNTTLTTETGVGYQDERLGGKSDSFATVRLAEHFEHKFDGHARVWQTAELLPQLNLLDNFLVNFEVGLETPITRTLSLTTCLDDNYANRPASGYQKNDLKIVSGLTYKF